MRMNSVWKQMEARALSSMEGTTWGEFLRHSLTGSPAVQAGRGRNPEIRTRFHHQKKPEEQRDPGKSGTEGARCESGADSVKATISKCHEGLKYDVRVDSQRAR